MLGLRPATFDDDPEGILMIGEVTRWMNEVFTLPHSFRPETSVSERFCSETLISARNAASVKSEPIFEIARNFSEHIPINSEQLVGIPRI